MKKIALIALAVMAVVGMFAVQPADAKKVEQDPVVAPIDMPMNDEIQQVNGVSKSTVRIGKSRHGFKPRLHFLTLQHFLEIVS